MFWPSMNKEIGQHCQTYTSCQASLPSQMREPMMPVKRPERPFQVLHVDLFDYAAQKYLACVDDFSGWLSLNALGKHASTKQMLTALRDRFIEKSVPEVLFSDNGPQLASHEMETFLRQWGVIHKTSSPGYPQSNGTAEAGVKQLKKMVKGSYDHIKNTIDWDKFGQGLLSYTPRYDGQSPAELLFGRNIRDTLPAHRISDLSMRQKKKQRGFERKSWNTTTPDLVAYLH